MWPIHPKPFTDELLSSWIARIAHQNKIQISKFFELALLDKSASLKEIDRTDCSDLIRRLSENTGVPEKQIAALSLLADEAYIFNFREYGKTMWVIPTSSSTPSDRRGLAFCPDCYNKDEVAYYRKRWRYSFNPICPEHKRFLLQTCPACNNPCHYLQYASKPLSNTDINTCNVCNAKLSIVAPPETADPFVIASILNVQQRLWSGIETGTFEVGEYKIPSLAYLRVLHSLANTLVRPAHLKWVTEHYSAVIPEKLNMSKLINYEVYIAPPEMQRPQESGVLIYIADLLIRDWPRNFEHYFSARELKMKPFLANKLPPFWIADSCPVISCGTTYKIAPEEKANASSLLAKKLRRKPSPKELLNFMETGKVTSMVKARESHRRLVAHSPEKFTLEPNTGTSNNPYRVNQEEFKKLASVAGKLEKIAVLRKSKKPPKQNQDLQIDLF